MFQRTGHALVGPIGGGRACFNRVLRPANAPVRSDRRRFRGEDAPSSSYAQPLRSRVSLGCGNSIEPINFDVPIDASDALLPDFGQSAWCITQHRDRGRYHAIHANAFRLRFHSGRDVDRIPIERDIAPEIAFFAGNDVAAVNSNAKIRAYTKALFVLGPLLIDRGV